MRWNGWGIMVLGLCFCLPAWTAEALSLHVADGDVRVVLHSIAEAGGINLVLDDSVQGSITLSLDDVEPEEACQLIACAKGLSMEKNGNTVLLAPAERLQRGLSSVHIFTIRYADPEILRSAVNLSLGKEGISPPMQNIKYDVKSQDESAPARDSADKSPLIDRLMVDRETNHLLFYGTEAEAKAAERIIDELDVPAQQVSLEARVIAIQKDVSKKLGIEWEWSKLPQYPSTDTSYESIQHAVPDGNGSYSVVTEDVPKKTVDRVWRDGESVPGVFQFGRGPEGQPFELYYAATLNALITDGKAKVLARPNITTIQGREAVINIGGEVPVPTMTVTNSTVTTSLNYRQAGIILRYTPRVNADGYITADVHTEVSSPLYVDELKAYRFQKRSADTMVRLKDGETMVIGGLIGSEESRSLSKVPFLGDLPILGAFFRSVRNSKTDSEIMIFLTAHVLEDGKDLIERGSN